MFDIIIDFLVRILSRILYKKGTIDDDKVNKILFGKRKESELAQRAFLDETNRHFFDFSRWKSPIIIGIIILLAFIYILWRMLSYYT
jgi:hypothetical protein